MLLQIIEHSFAVKNNQICFYKLFIHLTDCAMLYYCLYCSSHYYKEYSLIFFDYFNFCYKYALIKILH